MDIVVVESPAKAKTINKYLGNAYTVLASYGHIRDLPSKDGSVKPDEGFAMIWEVDPRSEKHIRDIAKAAKGAKHLYLATDPDREGEAISWHVLDELSKRNALDGCEVKRVVFNEVTKTAVLDALKNPRDVDAQLVNAYMARRALDYLFGFTLSPILWRKLPGSRSAGRVQSVALRLICERESEIERFQPREYWTVEADMRTASGAQFTANLTHLDGNKLDKFDLADAGSAQKAADAVRSGAFRVKTVEKRQSKRHPFPPFTTSTLQQEASRKLGFSAKQTMQIAQRLYEGIDIGGETQGLITYMRTDGVTMAQEAVMACRDLIGRDYGRLYLPQSPRMYKTKTKGAQEAHEAVRPTDVARKPADLTRYLERDQLRLYELIWKRTIASQMESALLDQVTADMGQESNRAVLRATGSTIAFDGFLALYREDRDDPEDDESDRRLPPLTQGDHLDSGAVRPLQHFTQPLPRYTEASLVKKLEELGIGRPSTYASIISVLQDRNYVRLESKRFIPEDRGRLVTAFLENFFPRYVQYNFTADLEDKLDDITDGQADWKALLGDFWNALSEAVGSTKELRVSEVIETLDAMLGPHFFPPQGADTERACPSCRNGRLGLKLGKFGAFIGCSNYPECRYTRPLAVAGENDNADELSSEPRALGDDPKTGLPISLRKGPYGFYVQLGEAPPPAPKAEKGKGKTKGKKTDAKAEKPAAAPKPKRVSLPRGMSPADVDQDKALALLTLPREIGTHPETGQMILAGLGRFGPYLKHGDAFKSLPKDDDVLTVGLNRAVIILAEAAKGGRGGRTPGRALGAHPTDGKPVTARSGRYGAYVSHGKINATLPAEMDMAAITMDEAVALLAARAEKSGVGKAAPKKAAPKKAAATKTDAPKAKKTAPAKKKAPAKKASA